MRRVEDDETHKKKVDWPRLLEAAHLGDERLLREIRQRLRAKTTHFWQDHVVVDCEDNATRMRATELLARLLGKDKAELNVSGRVELGTAAEMSPAERAAFRDAYKKRLAKELEAEGWRPPDGNQPG